jgi:hypothetical protein|tara:strand:+ start:1217 stop:1429 length:213 start_codon:yes stop_codon:yes gene_type:complete
MKITRFFSWFTIFILSGILVVDACVKVSRVCSICNKECFKESIFTEVTGAKEISYEHALCLPEWEQTTEK